MIHNICPECGHELSNTDRKCQLCGCSIYNKKDFLHIYILLCCIIVILIFIGYKAIKNDRQIDKYNVAISLKNEKKYDQAEKLFLELGNFKDSKEQIKQIEQIEQITKKYDSAISLKNEKKYDQAEQLFIELNDYKDSKNQLDEINKEYAEQIAEVYGNVYAVAILSWIETAAYADAFSSYNKTNSTAFVENFMSNNLILNGLSLRNEELEKAQKTLDSLRNFPSKHADTYKMTQKILDNAQDFYALTENPLLYYDSYFVKSNNLFNSLKNNANDLDNHMQTYNYYEDIKNIFDRSFGNTMDKISLDSRTNDQINFDNNSNNQYLFNSDKEYITVEYLQTKNEDEVTLILNEMYARHGYIFTTEKYKQYFSGKSWYNPIYTSEKDAEKHFNEFERENKKRLVSYSESKGWR